MRVIAVCLRLWLYVVSLVLDRCFGNSSRLSIVSCVYPVLERTILGLDMKQEY